MEKIRWLFEIQKRIVGELGFDVLSITQKGIRKRDVDSNDGQLSMDYSKYQLVEAGDFAMNHMDLLTGYVDISPSRGVTSPDYRVFSIRDASVASDRFFLRLFQNAYTNKIFYAYGQGSSQLGRWRFPADQFNDFRLPFPSIGDQVVIANFLDRETCKIDALVEEQEKLVALLKEKRQALISHAVTKGLYPNVAMKDSGIEWLGDVPLHWEIRRIKNVSDFVTSGPRGWSERITDEGALFIQSGDLNDRLQIDFARAKRVSIVDDAEAVRTQLRNGDIVLCITGAKTGNVGICSSLEEPAFINQHVCLIRPNKAVSSGFLGSYLKSGAGQTNLELVQYGLKQGLSLENVREAIVPIPPISEQVSITEHISRSTSELDVLMLEAEHAIDLLNERRAALISAAVTGKIDVRNYRS